MRISDWSSDVCSSDLAPAIDMATGLRVFHLQCCECHRFGALIGNVGAVLTLSVGKRSHNRSHILGQIQANQGADRDQLTRQIVTFSEIGRASCRERVCQYVKISVVAVALTKKK